MDILKKRNPQKILDVATGTGDLAIALSEIKDAKITGIDISEKMLDEGRQKLSDAGLDSRIELFKGDAEKMLFPDNTFDAVSVAFGVRNFENLEAGISEIKRVLKPGGTCVILEFAQPQKFPVKQVYHLYFKFVCPFWGRLIAGDDRAYKYLAESVYNFPFNEQFLNILKTAGFRNCHYVPLTFGIASIYVAEK